MHSVTLNIPPSIYEHGAEVIAVFFDLYGGAPALEPVHGDVVLLQVMYNHHDLNRDGYIDNADVLIALTRYFAGEMSWAQYQAVLQAAGQ
jgi:hypothetical protein